MMWAFDRPKREGHWSPIDLPEIVAAHLDGRAAEVLYAWEKGERWERIGLHVGTGTSVRNVMRKHTRGWRDVDLDDGWIAVVRAAAKVGEVSVLQDATEGRR